MDPQLVHSVGEALGPVLVCITFSATLFGILALNTWRKLKLRELDLEAQLHGREAEARLQAMEMRQAAVEAALNAVAVSLNLGAPAADREPGRQPALPAGVSSIGR